MVPRWVSCGVKSTSVIMSLPHSRYFSFQLFCFQELHNRWRLSLPSVIIDVGQVSPLVLTVTGGIQALSARPTGFLQCFDTIGLVIWPEKIVSDMTYNVFGGTLNLAQSIYRTWHITRLQMIMFQTTSPWAVELSWHKLGGGLSGSKGKSLQGNIWGIIWGQCWVNVQILV